MTTTGKLRVACVGAGYFSRFQYESWARMERVALVGACNRTLSKAQATGLPAYDDLPRMLQEVRPDVLDVILPPEAQAAAIDAAIAAGVATVICQKPFGTDLEEARRITSDAAAAGTRIVIHENFRFQPWYRAIKQALDAGAVGMLQQATFRFRPGDGWGPDAYLDRQPYFRTMERFLVHETAVHWIDTFRYLMGAPRSVYADLRRVNPAIAGEDAGYVLFDHATGVRALFDGNRCLDHSAENRRRTMGEGLFEGTEGTLVLSGDGSVRLRRFGTVEETEILPPDTWEGFGGDCVHALQMHVVSGLLDGTIIENTAEAYLPVIEIEEAVYRSAAERRKIDLETT
ncbi:Gfo/Idh/MocA family protein [Tropicimonas sediminicola]|uniref:Predicted dehydrogenase n=1 Tax=Tropicimonas sediminicola TaxID=1031541 RepID=A0A239LLU6_9RHOB|nr:Gfo/Idh/MocA family oxidoreductase [Tropicimonas sediminicola]SNT31345.1 Predicted dehydrogenase [Tropicimonas sediminicola]